MMNLPATEQFSLSGIDPAGGFPTRVFTSFMNLRGEMTGQKRFMWYALAAQDRKGFAESCRRISGWDFDRIVPCHGDVIETGGKSVFQQATAWFRDL